ncbi:MAG TPA: hypothetical protein VFZ97_11760 [Acidimicrobiales bacterium]
MNLRSHRNQGLGESKPGRKSYLRHVVAGGTAVLILSAGGIAWATWTNTATGSSAAGGGTLSLTVVSAGSSFTNKLFPGSVAGQASGATEGGDLVLNVTNPQNFAVKITAVTQNGPVTQSGGSGSPACTSDTQGTANSSGGFNISTFGNSGVWISATQPTGTSPTVYTTFTIGSAVTVAANATNTSVTLPNVVSMATSSANGCQGATFTMPVILSISM